MRRNAQAGDARRVCKLLFYGQCLQFGYEGVSAPLTYPQLTKAALETQFPDMRFKVALKPLYHPKGLKALLRRGLWLMRPDYLIITLPAAFAATAWRVNLITMLAPEITYTAREFLQKIDAKLMRNRGLENFVARNVTWRPSVVEPPLALDQYEALVEESIAYARRISRSRLVLIGPGRLNEYAKPEMERESPQLWAAVNQMIQRLGKRLNVPTINAHDALYQHSGDVLLRNNHRFSHFGHEVVACEVAAAIADEVRVRRAQSHQSISERHEDGTGTNVDRESLVR